MKSLTSCYHFPTLRGEDLADYSLEDLMTRRECYQDLRLQLLDEGSERASSIEYLEHRILVMSGEIGRRQRLRKLYKADPLAPAPVSRRTKRYQEFMQLARDLKELWPIDRFCAELFNSQLVSVGNGRWKTRCLSPAHNDATPSLMLYPDGHGHCFGCGWTGDIFDLVRLHFGIESFREAVLKLADATSTEVNRALA